jgi:hypothetical protein
MLRREFITLLGGAAAAWPLAAHAQQSERVRRVAILLPAAADDPAWQARVGAFLQGLGQLGWSIGRNLHKADIQAAPSHLCFWGNSGHHADMPSTAFAPRAPVDLRAINDKAHASWRYLCIKRHTVQDSLTMSTILGWFDHFN